MKSCLKSPPSTPGGSVPCTPCSSGNVSPGSANVHLPCLRKTVSFCEKDDGLEEFFQADDWDRTPAPVAPKLSYDDLLELKQLMKSLPRAPYNSCPRLPFTTSMPGSTSPAASTCAAAFPISRLAASPSLTPSKWKNRDASSATVDPAILPYLDSVPIRLLPLLPTEAAESDSVPSYAPISSKVSESAAATAGPAPLCSQSTAPLVPPITLHSPNGSSPVSLVSPSPAQSSTPTRRKPNFSFVPLLPVHEEKKAREEPSVPLLVHSAPHPKHFNMTFVPLLPPEDAAPPTPTSTSPPQVDSELHSGEDTPQKEGPSLEDEAHMRRERAVLEDAESSYFSVELSRHRRSPTSTPSLSSASDTDTESDAPSVNSPDPSSPADDYDALTHYFASHPSTHTEHGNTINSADPESLSATHANHNPYFPAIPSHSRTDAALSNTPLAAAQATRSYAQPAAVAAAVKKMRLEALPSPALVPPSPFSLYPEEKGAFVRVSAVPGAGAGKRISLPLPLFVSGLSPSSSTSASTSASSSSLPSSAASEDGDADTEKEDADVDVDVVDLARLRVLEPSPAPSYVSDTPELTIEAMREAYDDLAATRIEERAVGTRELLGPSLSRV